MLITVTQSQLEGHTELHNQVRFLNLAKYPMEFEPVTFQYLIKHLNQEITQKKYGRIGFLQNKKQMSQSHAKWQL